MSETSVENLTVVTAGTKETSGTDVPTLSGHVLGTNDVTVTTSVLNDPTTPTIINLDAPKQNLTDTDEPEAITDPTTETIINQPEEPKQNVTDEPEGTEYPTILVDLTSDSFPDQENEQPSESDEPLELSEIENIFESNDHEEASDVLLNSSEIEITDTVVDDAQIVEEKPPEKAEKQTAPKWYNALEQATKDEVEQILSNVENQKNQELNPQIVEKTGRSVEEVDELMKWWRWLENAEKIPDPEVEEFLAFVKDKVIAEQPGLVSRGVFIWKQLIQTLLKKEKKSEEEFDSWKKLCNVNVPTKQSMDEMFKYWDDIRERAKFTAGKLYCDEVSVIPNDLSTNKHFDFDIFDAGVKISLQNLLIGEANDKNKELIKAPISSMTAQNVNAIIGEQSNFMHFQKYAVSCSPIPCILSPLAIGTLLMEGHKDGAEFLNIITTDAQISPTYTNSLGFFRFRSKCAKKFILLGLNHTRHTGFKESYNILEEDEAVMSQRLEKTLLKHQNRFSNCHAVLSSSSKLPRFMKLIQSTLNLPCYDILCILKSFSNAYDGYTTKSVKEHQYYKGLQKYLKKTGFGTKVGIAGISGKDYKVTLTRERDHHGIKFVRISVPELGYGMMKKKFWKKNRTTLIEQLVANLHDAGCSVIIGENSLFHQYKGQIKSRIEDIFFCSTLSMLPFLFSVFNSNGKIIVLSTETAMVSAKWNRILKPIATNKIDEDRLILRGLERWDNAPNAENENIIEVRLIEIVMHVLDEYRYDMISCILIESYNLLPFSNTLRQLFGLPVFDHQTLVDIIGSGYANNPLVTPAQSLKEKRQDQSDLQADDVLVDADAITEKDKSPRRSLVEPNPNLNKTRTIESIMNDQVKDNYKKLRKKKKIIEEAVSCLTAQNRKSQPLNQPTPKSNNEIWNERTRNFIKQNKDHVAMYSNFLKKVKSKTYKVNNRPLWDEPKFDRYYGGLQDLAKEKKIRENTLEDILRLTQKKENWPSSTD